MEDLQRPERGDAAQESELGPRPRKQRVGIRIDMTPMVDVAFLLLIFFMVTTVFRRPLAMEVNMPEPGAKVAVPESNVMTLYIDTGDAVYYRLGKDDIAPIPWSDLSATFQAQAAANPDIIFLVKIHREARYENMVDMMDTLEDAHMERFSLIPMREDDLAELESLR